MRFELGITNSIPSRCGYKVSFIEKRRQDDGSLLWHRDYKNLNDTSCYPDPVWGNWDENQLHDVHLLPDGSIIACGEFINWGDTIHPQQGWLIHVNENGCFNNDCSDTTGIEPISGSTPARAGIHLYPNPCSDQLTVEISARGNPVEDATLMLYDIEGKLMQSYVHINTHTSYFLSLKNYASEHICCN
jgi:hypothetical protein